VQERLDLRLRADELRRTVARAVVERHHAVDVRQDVGEPAGEKTHLVAKRQHGEQAPAIAGSGGSGGRRAAFEERAQRPGHDARF
jgi:hypothetical protein